MKVYIVAILVLATLTCSALAKSGSGSAKATSAPKGSCKKSDTSCKACFDGCYKWSNTNVTTLLTSTIIHIGISGYIHKEDTDRKIPAAPSKECTGSGSSCKEKCKVAKVSYRSTSLKVGSTLEIHSCGKCDANEKDIPWEKTPTAHEDLSKITGAEMMVEFKCSGYSVRASLMVLLLGVLLTLKAAF